ncbi:MAG: ABC transporter permease [SAR202 cluster bacterium]|nr:ABC transporter permease [SAR202 cluster bacterium]
MSPDRTLAIAERIIRQIVKDRRSMALVVVAPLIVMALVGFSLIDQKPILNRVAPGLLGTFAMFFTFLLTGVSFLRERAQGTLERLMTTTVARGDILVGYLLGFLLFATIQAAVILVFIIVALQIEYQGSIFEIVAVLMLVVLVAVNLGIFVSTFARNEFQVVQFIPIVLAPQIFLSGVIVPTDQMPTVMEAISVVLPLTYAVEGLRGIMVMGQSLADVWTNLVVLAGFGVGLLIAAIATLRRT